MFVFANILQPLIDLTEAIMKFFHDNLGFSWGFSIIALTLVVRSALLPLTLRQSKSMQKLAQLQPQMKVLQEKYKGDKQRLNQEMMKFYQANKVNPLGSCLPLVAQLPIFLSLFYMLRKDLKIDICPGIAEYAARTGEKLANVTCSQFTNNPLTDPTLANPDPGSEQFLFIPDLTEQGHGRGARGAADHVRGLAAGVEPPDDGHRGQEPAPADGGAPVRLHHLHHQLPRRPARVLDHHELLDDRAAVHRAQDRGADQARGGDGRCSRDRADRGDDGGGGGGGRWTG